MYVLKRDGRKELVHFDKISARISKLAYGINTKFVEPLLVAQKVIQGVYNGVTTTELDELAAETAASMSASHHDYGHLCFLKSNFLRSHFSRSNCSFEFA